MSFLEHLEELRWRIIKIVLGIAACAIPCGIFWKRIFDVVMLYPLRFAEPKPRLIFTSPAESVMVSFKIAIGAGLVCATPLIFYQMWKFIAPGLYQKEKRIVIPAAVASTAAFLGGIAFCYFMLPHVLRLLSGYAAYRLDPYFKINDYFGFLLKLSLAFGAIFELPVVSFVLARMGLLTTGFLIRHSRVAIVIIFVVAAIVTPPDVFSQLIMAGPLLLLYGLSIVVVYFAGRKA